MMNSQLIFTVAPGTFIPISFKNGFSNFIPCLAFDARKSFVFPLLHIASAGLGTETRIPMLQARRIHVKFFSALFANKFWMFNKMKPFYARARAKLLSFPMIWFWDKHFSANLTKYGGDGRLALVLAFIGTISSYIFCSEYSPTCTANKIFISNHFSIPFDGLCEKWGRMAKVSIFSVRVITPHLSLSDCITGGRNFPACG